MKTKSLKGFLATLLGLLCVSCIGATTQDGLSAGTPVPLPGAQSAAGRVKGFTLTELGSHRYDANPGSVSKTEAQYIVDRLYDLGVRHVVLSPRAIMRDPRQSYLELMTPAHELASERGGYLRLIEYVHGKGMTVGIRPIFFVVDSNGNIPYYEPQVGGGFKLWWHGNIQPADPAAWFTSFRNYMETYLEIANTARIAEFTIGAELESMSIGIGPEWPANPEGFPRLFLELLQTARSRLAPGTRIVYDMNYTDDEVLTIHGVEYGGELLRWRKALVDDRANGAPPTARWNDLADFYRGLDSVGVDMYRSLASATEVLPVTYPELVAKLKETSDEHAQQLGATVTAMNAITGVTKGYLIKEAGFKSVERGFVDPFNYAGTGTPNLEHQAAAYEAVLASFLTPANPLFQGITFWDVSVDTTKHGVLDNGFSPIGKAQTEQVLSRYFALP